MTTKLPYRNLLGMTGKIFGLNLVVYFLIMATCCFGQTYDTVDLTTPVIKKDARLLRVIPPTNSLYLELGGHLNLFSVNNERILLGSRDQFLSARIGAGYTPPSIQTFSLMGTVGGMFRVSRVLFFEVGAGIDITCSSWNHPDTSELTESLKNIPVKGSFIDPLLTGYLGLRVQKQGGFLFRIGFTPVYELTDNPGYRTAFLQLGTRNRFVPWLGMSFGYSFY